MASPILSRLSLKVETLTVFHLPSSASWSSVRIKTMFGCLLFLSLLRFLLPYRARPSSCILELCLGRDLAVSTVTMLAVTVVRAISKCCTNMVVCRIRQADRQADGQLGNRLNQEIVCIDYQLGIKVIVFEQCLKNKATSHATDDS